MSKQEWGYIRFLLRDILKREKGRFATMALLSLTEGLLPYISIVGMGVLLDEVYNGADGKKLLGCALVILLGTFFCRLLMERFLESFSQKLDYTKDLEAREMNRKSLSMDYEYLEDDHVQDLRSSAFSKSFFGIRGWFLWHLHDICKSMVSFILTLCIFVPTLFETGEGLHARNILWLMLGLCLMLGAVFWGNYQASIRYIRKVNKIFNASDGLYTRKKYFADLLSGADSQKDLKINSQQDAIDKEIGKICRTLRENQSSESRLFIKRKAVNIASSQLSCFLIYLFVSLRAFMGLISIGNVVVYAAAMVQLMDALNHFSVSIGHMKQMAMFAKDYADFMGLEKRKYTGTIPVEKRRDNRFQVSFEHVSFRYPGSAENVINDLTLSFEIGEKMAIVGKNGSGKTTFIKLLCRLYDVTEGVIKVNGIDIRKYDPAEYSRLFAVVFQDFSIFAFSLGENIASSDKTEEPLVRDSLTKAGLGERLAGLPQGLDTYVGKEYHSDGITFSGGEKQKMAIARAIYKNAPFVIMDEPTAALDPLAECEVYAGFDKMVGNKTALYISHRLASCRFCEDILVFDRGRVIQRGSHEELKAQDGLYRELWNAQAQYYEGEG